MWRWPVSRQSNTARVAFLHYYAYRFSKSSVVRALYSGGVRTNHDNAADVVVPHVTPPTNEPSFRLHEIAKSAEGASNRIHRPALGPLSPTVALARFLSRSNMHASPEHTTLYTPSALRALYLAARPPHTLDASRISRLVSILGGIALCSQKGTHSPSYHNNSHSYEGEGADDDDNNVSSATDARLLPSVYDSPIVRRMIDARVVSPFSDVDARTTWWPLVLTVLRDKKAMRMKLSHSDRYWAMRAHIATIHAEIVLQPDADPTPRTVVALARAEVHYNHIEQHISDPEVHTAFLDALLALRTPKYNAQALAVLSALLSRLGMVHSRVRDVLWCMVLRPDESLRASVLDVVWACVVRRRDAMLARASAEEPPRVDGSAEVSDGDVRALGVFDLAHVLTTAMFLPYWQPLPSDSVRAVLQRWAISEVAAALSPDLPFVARWHNLVLVALCNASCDLREAHSGASDTAAAADADKAHAGSDSWRTVFVLANLEKTLASALPPSALPDTRALVRMVFRTWSARALAGPVGEARFVARAAAASFLRLAARLHDAPLVAACHRLCIAADLWLADAWDATARAQVRALAVEHALASAACGGEVHDAIAGVSHVWLGPDWRELVVEGAIMRLARSDAIFAAKFLDYAVENTLKIAGGPIVRLAIALVEEGQLDRVLLVLKYPGLSAAQLEKILGHMLFCLASSQRLYLPLEVVTTVGELLQSLYSSKCPPSSWRERLQYYLPVMVASRQPRVAAVITRGIHLSNPQFFTALFLSRFIRMLMKHRQFRLALRLLSALENSHASVALCILPWSLRALSRGGAHRLAFRLDRVAMGGGLSRSSSLRLLRATRYKMALPARVLSLKLLSLFGRTEKKSPDTLVLLALLLTRSGRVRAAQGLLAQHRETVTARTRTVLGNTILHGLLLQNRRRNAQLMKQVIKTLNYLVAAYQFTPDRVTVNILLKAMLRWRTLDSQRLRALFDHVVRHGYSSFSEEDQQRGPFGTPVSSRPELTLPSVTTSLSFERHVRPMYKMFTKAFYMRGDSQAAKVVIGLWKAQERDCIQQMEDSRRQWT